MVIIMWDTLIWYGVSETTYLCFTLFDLLTRWSTMLNDIVPIFFIPIICNLQLSCSYNSWKQSGIISPIINHISYVNYLSLVKLLPLEHFSYFVILPPLRFLAIPSTSPSLACHYRNQVTLECLHLFGLIHFTSGFRHPCALQEWNVVEKF